MISTCLRHRALTSGTEDWWPLGRTQGEEIASLTEDLKGYFWFLSPIWLLLVASQVPCFYCSFEHLAHRLTLHPGPFSSLPHIFYPQIRAWTLQISKVQIVIHTFPPLHVHPHISSTVVSVINFTYFSVSFSLYEHIPFSLSSSNVLTCVVIWLAEGHSYYWERESYCTNETKAKRSGKMAEE